MEQAFETQRFTFQSEADGTQLNAVLYQPKEPKGIVQFVHGMSEHIGRYEEVMQFLAKNGYVTCAHDHRGHGGSVQDNENLSYFGEDGKGQAIVQDTVQFTRLMKEKYPGLPVYLFGHSMGSLVVRCYLQQHDDEIEKLVVSGSPNQNGAVGIAILLTKIIGAFKGQKHRSKMLVAVSTGGAGKRFPDDGPVGWLSRDKEVVKRFMDDEKCGVPFTVNGFDNLFHLLKNTYKKKLYEVKNAALPIFFMAGSEDPIIGNEKKWLKGQKTLRDVGYEKVSGKLYPGMRHEPHAEIGKEEAWQDLLNFLES